jgi:hypothetical protein
MSRTHYSTLLNSFDTLLESQVHLISGLLSHLAPGSHSYPLRMCVCGYLLILQRFQYSVAVQRSDEGRMFEHLSKR